MRIEKQTDTACRSLLKERISSFFYNTTKSVYYNAVDTTTWVDVMCSYDLIEYDYHLVRKSVDDCFDN